MSDPNQNTPGPLASGQRLDGTAGKDVLTGGLGADVIEAGGGFGDLLTGGGGSDLFTFNGALNNGRRDFTVIAEYEIATADGVGDFIGLDVADILFMRAVGNRAFIYYGPDFDVIVLNGVSDVDDIQFFPQRIEAALTGFGLGAIARVGVTPTMFHSLQDALDDAGTVSGATLEVGEQDAPLHAAVTRIDDTATVLTLTSVMGSGITLKAGDGANDLELTANTSGSAAATLRAATLSGAHVTMGDGDNALTLTATASGVGGGLRSVSALTDGASLTLGHGANVVKLHADATSTNGGRTVANALYAAEITFGDGGNFLGVYLDSHKTGMAGDSDADIYAVHNGSRVSFGAGADTFLMVANASGDANADDVALDGFKGGSKLYMGAGDDTVTLTLTASTNGGDDHDLDDVEALDSGSLIDTGDGDDTVAITITASAYGPDAEVFATGVDSVSAIALGEGDNTFNLTITGFSADDTEDNEDVEIYGFDNGSSLAAGGGNDTVTLTLTAEGGTDYIEVIGFRNSVVDLGDGTNHLALTGLAKGTAAAGDQSESYGFSSSSSFVGGDGADTLTLAMTAVSANDSGARAAGVERGANIDLGAGANALEITSAAISTQNGSALAFGIRDSGTVVSGGDDGNRLALTVSADSARGQATARGIDNASVTFGVGADSLTLTAAAEITGVDAAGSQIEAMGLFGGSTVTTGDGDDTITIALTLRGEAGGAVVTALGIGPDQPGNMPMLSTGAGDDVVSISITDETTGVAASRRVAGVEGATIDLGAGDDHLELDSADGATLLGGDGADTIVFGGGTATIDGGDGIDTLVLTGVLDDYSREAGAAPDAVTLELVAGGTTINVSSIESFTFDNGTFSYADLLFVG